MIEQISHFSCKSFKDYTSPSHFFKQKNILFGYNGRGKSSLALGIVDNYKSSGGTDDSYRLFNRDYVKKTLLLNDDTTLIKGVKVTFSENDAEIATKIQELEKQKVDTKDLRDEIDNKNKNLRKKIDEIHDKSKGKAKINKKRADLSNDKVIELYKIDLEKAHAVKSSDDFIKAFDADNENLEKQKGSIENTRFPELRITKLSQDEKEFLNNTLKKSYNFSDELPPLEELNWLEKGIELHEETDKQCKFCQNYFNLQDVINRVKEYKENEKQKDIKRLAKIKSKIKLNLLFIENDKAFSENLSKINIDSKEMDIFYSSDCLSEVKDLVSIIDSKIENMNYVFDTTNCITTFEQQIEQIREKIKEAFRETIKEIDDSINNIEILAKGKIALALQEQNITKDLKEIHKLELNLSNANKDNKEIDKKVKELEDKQSEYTDFMNFLNDILESLGIQIKLILSEENYYLQHSIEKSDLTIDDISEGEKNLLSLLYFYFELYTDNEQKQLNKAIDLIVVDDPISSLDDSNKFYVLEIIKQIIDEKNPQIFVLTHSWDDFCQLTYKIKNNQNAKLLEIYKDSTKDFQSALRECSTNISPYKKLFTELNELSKKNLSDLDNCDNYHAANSMRRVFEEFLNFKKPNLLPQKRSQKQLEDMYYRVTGEEMSAIKKQKLGSLLSFINVLSHRPIRSDEILANCKFLMEFIKTMDKVHYDSMTR